MLCGKWDQDCRFLLYQYGEFRFPNAEAARIAVRTMLRFLEIHGQEFDRVIFNVFKDVDREIYRKMLSAFLEKKKSGILSRNFRRIGGGRYPEDQMPEQTVQETCL